MTDRAKGNDRSADSLTGSSKRLLIGAPLMITRLLVSINC